MIVVSTFRMSELNVYVANNFLYDFSKTQEGYLTNLGLSDTLTPSDPDIIFEYTTYTPLTAASVVLFSPDIPEAAVIRATILNEDNIPIPGTETQIQVPELPAFKKSKYTFTTPLEPGSKLRFQVTSTDLDSIGTYVFCNATIYLPESS